MDRIILNNRYEIIEKIGGGGMAEVFHGYDSFLKRDVAVKLLRDKYVQDKSFIERFRQEARSAAKLLHPNIVNVYDVGMEKGFYYIVMEYVVGRNLKEYIKEQGPLSPREAIAIAKGIASALAHAHRHGVIHCDIKSHNILIDSFGNVKVTDFGIAKAITVAPSQPDNVVVGSVYYLSPEQACGRPLTPQSDIYSIGVILFEMLTGKLPFDAGTPAEVALQHVQTPVPSMRSLVPDVPVVLDNIAAKALAKNLAVRYKTAAEFKRALELAEKKLYGEDVRTVQDTLVFPPASAVESENDGATMVITRKEILSEQHLEEDSEAEPSTAHKGIKKIYIMVAAALMVLFGVVYMVDNSRKATVVVPNIEGKSVVEAQELLTNNKLTYVLSEEFSDTVKAGLVSLQIPAANEKVKEGRQIRVVVSKGMETGVVPELKNKTISEVKSILKQAKLQLGDVTIRYAKGVPANAVIDQSISPKSKVAANSKIDLVVNISDKQTVVPNIVNTSLANATATLMEMGLKLGTITKVTSKEKENLVLAANPAVGAIVDKNSAVALDVAVKDASKPVTGGTTAPEASGSRIEEFVVPNGAGMQQVVLVVINDKGTKNVYGNLLKPGAKISKRIDIEGNTRVQFYSNGVLVEDRQL